MCACLSRRPSSTEFIKFSMHISHLCYCRKEKMGARTPSISFLFDITAVEEAPFEKNRASGGMKARVTEKEGSL